MKFKVVLVEFENKTGSDGSRNGNRNGVGLEIDLVVVEKNGRDDRGETNIKTVTEFTILNFDGKESFGVAKGRNSDCVTGLGGNRQTKVEVVAFFGPVGVGTK